MDLIEELDQIVQKMQFTKEMEYAVSRVDEVIKMIDSRI
jgi:hypothetical protein